MKIALVSADAAPADPDERRPEDRRVEYVAQLARELGAAGHVVDVFTRRNDLWSMPVVDLSPNARAVNVPAGPPRFVPADALLAHMDDFATRFVQACAHGGRYDVVHASGFLSGIAALRLKQRCGTPFVVTFHELSQARERPALGRDRLVTERARVEAALIAAADRIVARGRQELDDVVALYGTDTDRIEVVPPGVDPTAFRPGSRASRRIFGLSADDFVMMQAARFRPGEGSDTAIRAVARLKKLYGVDVRLVICGETAEGDAGLPSALARLRELAAAERVAEQVKFVRTRSRSTLREAYCSADVVVATPSSGACAEPPLEAMACGTR
jgi:D-inositol-3-phosphate glycosyltransferase